jgi:hypothetical protein
MTGGIGALGDLTQCAVDWATYTTPCGINGAFVPMLILYAYIRWAARRRSLQMAAGRWPLAAGRWPAGAAAPPPGVACSACAAACRQQQRGLELWLRGRPPGAAPTTRARATRRSLDFASASRSPGMRTFLEMLSLPYFLAATSVPQAVGLYWLANTSAHYALQRFSSRPVVAKALGLPLLLVKPVSKQDAEGELLWCWAPGALLRCWACRRRRHLCLAGARRRAARAAHAALPTPPRTCA